MDQNSKQILQNELWASIQLLINTGIAGNEAEARRLLLQELTITQDPVQEALRQVASAAEIVLLRQYSHKTSFTEIVTSLSRLEKALEELRVAEDRNNESSKPKDEGREKLQQ